MQPMHCNKNDRHAATELLHALDDSSVAVSAATATSRLLLMLQTLCCPQCDMQEGKMVMMTSSRYCHVKVQIDAHTKSSASQALAAGPEVWRTVNCKPTVHQLQAASRADEPLADRLRVEGPRHAPSYPDHGIKC